MHWPFTHFGTGGIGHVAHACGGRTARQFFEKKSAEVFSTSGLRVFATGAPHWPSRPQPVITLSQSAVVAHARLARSDVTFCWSASHACFFEGIAVVDADADALVTADIGGDMPAVNEDAGVIGSCEIAAAASLRGAVSLGFVHASGRIAMAARTLFNRAP